MKFSSNCNSKFHYGHHLPRTNPIPNSTTDQSRPTSKWTDPIYAIKHPPWGFKKEQPAAAPPRRPGWETM